MAVLAPQAIEPGRKRRLQPLHPRHEVSLRGFDREVKVISHDDEGVQQPLAPCTRLEEAGLECGPGARVSKDPGAVVSAIDDVINRAWEFQP